MHRNLYITMELHKHARESALALDDQRAICRVVSPSTVVQPRLQALAMMVIFDKRGTEGLPGAEETLSTFFEEEAVALLSKTPNLYWFWKVVETTVIMEMGARARYTKANVLEAVTVLRAGCTRGTMGSVHDMERDGSLHRDSQIAMRTALGLAVLVPSTDGLTHYLTDNPVFIGTDFSA